MEVSCRTDEIMMADHNETKVFQEHFFGVLKMVREDLEEVNSHYHELIAVSREALKRKIQTENQFT